jgi:transposase
MPDLQTHYALLLGLTPDWAVESIDLSLQEKRVEIRLGHQGGPLECPECGQSCSCADHAPERTWRHLDTMQFETVLRARVPRCRCQQCGVKTIAVPWASKSSRFTWMFEAFAIEVLKAASSVQAASLLLRLDWDSANLIMRRGVERGLERRTVDQVQRVGLDEKSFLRGQSYASLMFDLDGARVLEVVPERSEEAADALWESLPAEQREQVVAVCMDMSAPYLKSTGKHVPQAAIVHDKFHVSKHLNEAVDQVRREEHKRLKKEGDERLTGSRQLWLFNPLNLTDAAAERFEPLKRMELKTARAWAIKEQFRWFWTYFHKGYARQFFDRWYGWASRSRLRPVIKKAKMLKRHLENLLTYTQHKVTNAMAEGFNSKIQSLKANARGFRSFANYRTRILFFCGRLDMRPLQASH